MANPAQLRADACVPKIRRHRINNATTRACEHRVGFVLGSNVPAGTRATDVEPIWGSSDGSAHG